LLLEVFTQRNFVAYFFDRSWKNAEFSWMGINEPTNLSLFWIKGHEQ